MKQVIDFEVIHAMPISFTLVLWDCWLGDRKGIQPEKKLDVANVGLLMLTFRRELCTSYCSSCYHHLRQP